MPAASGVSVVAASGVSVVAEVLALLLDPADWQVITDEAPQRSATDPDGRPVMIRDTVFRARRGG